MGNTTLANSQPEIDYDPPDLGDASRSPQEQSRLETNALEISGIRMYFEPERNVGNDDSTQWPRPFLRMPSNQQMIKIIPVSNNRDMLQITLMLDDFETEQKCEILPLKELYEEIQWNNCLPQNKNMSEKSEIITDQPMQMAKDEKLNLRKECGQNKSEEFVETHQICRILDYSIGNEKVFYTEASTSTDKNLALRCGSTTQTDLKETKHENSQTDMSETIDGDSQTDWIDKKDSDSQTDLREIKDGDSQTDLREKKDGDSQTDLRETNHVDSQTDLMENIDSDSQTDLRVIKDRDSQIDLREVKDRDSQTDLRENKDSDSQTDRRMTNHVDTQTDLREIKDGDSQTDLREIKDEDSQTELRETIDGDSKTDLRGKKESDSQTDLRETKNEDFRTDFSDTKHGDSQTDFRERKSVAFQTETCASDLSLPLLPHSHTESIAPLVSKHCDNLMQWNNIQKGVFSKAENCSLKTKPMASAERPVPTKNNFLMSCYTNNQSTVPATLAKLKETRHSELQTFDTNLLELRQGKSFTESNSFQDSANCYVQSNELNKDGYVNSGDCSSDTVPIIYIETPKKMSSPKRLCEITLKNIASATKFGLRETKDSSTQTDTIFQFRNTFQAKESDDCVHKETTSLSKVYKQGLSSNLHDVKDHNKISPTRFEFLTELEVAVLKRSRHPIFPCRLYKRVSSRKRIHRPSLRRNNPLAFSPKNSDVITSETVSMDTTLTENKRKHTLNPTSTDISKNHNLNKTSHTDGNNFFLNPILREGEVKYSPKTTPTQDAGKPSSNQFLNLVTDDKDLSKPTFIRDVRTHSLDSSSNRSKRKSSQSPKTTKDEKKHLLYAYSTKVGMNPLVPTTIINKEHLPGSSQDNKKYSPNHKIVPTEELVIAECMKGNSIAEKVIPISSKLQRTAKSFQLLRKEPVVPMINPASIKFVEYSTRSVKEVDCPNVNENKKPGITDEVRSEFSDASQNSVSVSTVETVGSLVTVVFRRNSSLDSATDKDFSVGLCRDCYTKTQRTLDEYLNRSVAMVTEVENKPICIESSSSSDVEVQRCIESRSSSDVEVQRCIELSSSSDAEVQQESESSGTTGVSESSLVKSPIDNLYPLCETVNDHLLDLKQVDEDLLKESISTLTNKWLAIAADRHSRTKEVYNYLRYFHEFSENLAQLVLHSTDPQGNNVLHFAFGNNRFDMAEELLNNKHGPALLSKRNKLGHTPLMICAISQPKTREDWMTVKKSVRLGNVNEVSLSGQTALMNAASRGCAEMVRVLLGAGADPDRRDGDGSTALMYAAEQGRGACAGALLEHCDPKIEDQDGQTASSIAIMAGHKDIALLIYLKIKKLPYKAMQQAIKAHKKKNLPNKKC